MKPIVRKYSGQHAWQRWAVELKGKAPVYFEHFYAAALFAIYAFRQPGIMADSSI